MVPLPRDVQPSNDKMVLLLAHYFRKVCVINSCFDSPANPLRSEIPALMTSSPLVQSCILSMSAGHLRNAFPHLSLDSLEYLTATVSELTKEIQTILPHLSSSIVPNQRFENALLGVIMLGVTTSWHVSSGLGLEHISGARALFRCWIDHKFRHGQVSDGEWSRLDFYLGLQAYWESMAAFLIDQDIHQLDYLDVAFTVPRAQAVCVHPWTGLSAIPWLCLAKAGCIVRWKRRLLHGGVLGESCTATESARLRSHLELSQASHRLLEELLRYDIPDDSQIADTFDKHTSKSDLRNLARCCQLAAMLECARSLDSGLEWREALDLAANILQDPSTSHFAELECLDLTYTGVLQMLALQILRLLSSIPTDSRTRSLHHLPLLIAGSVLLPQIMGNSPSTPPPLSNLECSDVMDDASSGSTPFWRRFVVERILTLEKMVNLDGHRTIRLLLSQVWTRGDALAQPNDHPQSAEGLHWVDVMEDMGLQFFL
ncbi:hypothetical protein PV08_04082 [Exophiala spinifera]|uniref:Transcription factor domain-containing protein n=1 Tax=Exophiala spinifera TaxID=91928 RepID=A0A0D1ZW26_9EURO|nr:uncharacterized protein PV08_04082 [Exophiala spinifera]KIW16892.1 hypothetical protein PV08_04082 [Exophiala spinifera]